MSDVRLIPLGVGEAFTALHYTTCLALGVDDDLAAGRLPAPDPQDAPRGVARGGHPARPRPDQRRCAQPPPRRPLLGPGRLRLLLVLRARPPGHDPGASRGLGPALGWPARRRHGGDPRAARRAADPQATRRLLRSRPSERNARVTFGPFAIECRPTIHSIPTTAFRIRAGGRILAFSADTAFDPTLIDWLAPADLIVHEVTTLPPLMGPHPLREARRPARRDPQQDAPDPLPRRLRPRRQRHRAAIPGALLQRLRRERSIFFNDPTNG